MLKWFKKNKLKFFSCFALCLCLSLFGFMAFSSKVYAYDVDDGNLDFNWYKYDNSDFTWKVKTSGLNLEVNYQHNTSFSRITEFDNTNWEYDSVDTSLGFLPYDISYNDLFSYLSFDVVFTNGVSYTCSYVGLVNNSQFAEYKFTAGFGTLTFTYYVYVSTDEDDTIRYYSNSSFTFFELDMRVNNVTNTYLVPYLKVSFEFNQNSDYQLVDLNAKINDRSSYRLLLDDDYYLLCYNTAVSSNAFFKLQFVYYFYGTTTGFRVCDIINNMGNFVCYSSDYGGNAYDMLSFLANYDYFVNNVDYDELLNKYNQLNNVLFNGWLGYCSSVLVTDNNDNTFRRFTYDYLVENNVITNGYFNYDRCVHLLSNFNSSHNYTISFTPRIYDTYEQIYLNYHAFFIQFEDNSFNAYNLLQIVDTNGYAVSYPNLNGLTVSSSDLFDEIRNSSFNGLIDTVNLVFVPSGVSSNSFTSNSDFANGYLEGQNASTQQFQQIIDNQNNTISDLENVINDKNQSIITLQTLYHNLQERYNEQLQGDNFINLFFTIAETPFASFKQIWNVDFLGVNLAGFVTGILFIGLIIWVVKKIF